MNIIIFLTESFPPKRMNANHNRIYNLITSIKKRHNVIIICPSERFEYSESKFQGLRIIKFPYLNIKIIGKIFMIFSAKKYLINILNKYNIKKYVLWYNSVIAFDVSKNFKCKKIYDVMGINSNEIAIEKNPYTILKSFFYRIFEKILYNNSDIITTINEVHKRYLSKRFKGKIFVIRDAMTDKLLINKNIYLKAKNDQKNKFTIFFVGSFSRKRFEKIIDAFKPISSKIKNLNIVIAGDGKYLEYYKNKFSKLGIINFFNFIGHTTGKNLNAHIKAADVCISDVYLDGFPYKIFEYMSMGKAILIEETPGVKEIIKNGYNGLLYKNAKDFENKIILLANNPGLRKGLEKQSKIESKKHRWNIRGKDFNKFIKKEIKI